MLTAVGQIGSTKLTKWARRRKKKDACGRDAIGVEDRELGRTGENKRW